MLCQDCPNRKFCLKLCPEAEVYVDQDAPVIHLCDEIHFTRMEKKILWHLGNGKTRSQIRKILNISIDTLITHIGNLRKKAKDIEL